MKINYLGSREISQELLSTFGGKAEKLHELLMAGFPVPAGFLLSHPQEVSAEAIAQIGGFPVAVRSSGSLEDLAGASFAGQYETFLDVNSPQELTEAISKCFASKNSDRVKDYLNTKNIEWNEESLKMSVLVQKMVNAKIAGVLFTLSPLTGREEEIYLEFCEGVGERLVSGHVTPSQIVYNWMEGKIVKETINDEGTRISEENLKELIDLSIKIQAHYGTPQDIEWAVGPDYKVYILQSRPITTFTPREDRPELTNADFKDGGVSARVCTPLMFSVYREAMRISMGDYLKKIQLISSDDNVQWIYYQYGRAYWNAGAVKEGLKKLPDFKEVDFDRDLGIQKVYGETGPHHTQTTVATVVGAIPVLLGLYREFRDCENMIDHFRVRFESQDEKLKGELKRISKMNDQEFHTWFFEVVLFQNETEKNYFRTIYNNSNFQTEYKNKLKKLPAYQEGDEIDMMSELHGVSHLDVQGGLQKLVKISDFYGFDSQKYHADREAFLKIHYHHGPAELDLTVPRWGENKQWVDELVRNFIASSPSEVSQFDKTFERLTQGLGALKRGSFTRMTKRSRKFLRLREEMRAYSTRAYYLLRLGILEFAKRTKLSTEDVFLLDIVEMKRKVMLPQTKLPDLRLRKAYYLGYSKFTPPNEFGGSIKATDISLSGNLKGLGCSPGVKIGRARVITDIHATNGLTKDDILITIFTDPGWTPVLARVGGVVTEVGGLLSHAAVIGREYGIPAILNLSGATKTIKDGALIKVDGKSGVVEILEEGP